jgi:hypothetical protein
MLQFLKTRIGMEIAKIKINTSKAEPWEEKLTFSEDSNKQWFVT